MPSHYSSFKEYSGYFSFFFKYIYFLKYKFYNQLLQFLRNPDLRVGKKRQNTLNFMGNFCIELISYYYCIFLFKNRVCFALSFKSLMFLNIIKTFSSQRSCTFIVKFVKKVCLLKNMLSFWYCFKWGIKKMFQLILFE